MEPTTPSDLLSNPAAWATQLATRAFESFYSFLPELILASSQLLLGLAGAWLARLIILRFERGLDKLLSTFQVGNTLSDTRSNWPLAAMLGNIAFWVIIAFSVVSASKTLQLNFLASWLQELLGYLPRLLISATILFIGNLVSQGLRQVILSYSHANDLQHGKLIAQTSAGLVLAFTLLLALDQLGLDVGLFENIITLAFAAFFGAAALAFGIGSADSVRNILASHYVRNQYQPGLSVRLDDLEGEILELTPVAVLLDTDEGQVLLPARLFMEKASLILEPEEIDGN